MTAVGGILAGLSFAVFFAICCAEKKHKVDTGLMVGFLLSALCLILATALSGLLAFSGPLAVNRKAAMPTVELVSDIAVRAWSAGFATLVLGMGVAGFRVSKRMGIFSVIASIVTAALFYFCMYRVGSAFGQFG